MKNFNFGENLRMIRIYRNVCQEGMATGLNISQASYSRIEASPDLPELQLINKLADTLGVRPKDLISANWYAQAVNGGSEKNKRTVATINHTGQVTYGILLATAAWDSTSGTASGAQMESINAILFIGSCIGLGAFFLYHFTVKHVKLIVEEDTLNAHEGLGPGKKA
ncbi:helix-turn-helix transcriptional regulator [Daejeonella sp. H1SJ63]|uniref:helix-turn-helix domain-containing protein n=1 Tax=Daejeonella sp. H1SJ63 TaxID=3034145 RepID=UPI0023EAA295|nr:helix-turn-helix transcriptional regulator [Daejeonella sp. H1SJ63]